VSLNDVASCQLEHVTVGMETGPTMHRSPVLERKNKMSAISRFFKPWTWNLIRRKPSEKIQKQATSMSYDKHDSSEFNLSLFLSFMVELFLVLGDAEYF